MKKNIFKIAFVTRNGKIMYYGYNKFPYLTREPNAAYLFSTNFYETREAAIREAEHLKEFFFGNDNEINIIIAI